jgi:flagellar hook-length control protein FliK
MKVSNSGSARTQESAKPARGVEKNGRFSQFLDEKRKATPLQSNSSGEPQPQSPLPFITGKSDTISSTPAASNIEHLATEIVDHISSREANGAQVVEIQFNSKTLDGLRVDVRSQQGLVSVNFSTSAPHVTDLLNDNIGSLRSALETKGVRVARLRVIRRTR